MNSSRHAALAFIFNVDFFALGAVLIGFAGCHTHMLESHLSFQGKLRHSFFRGATAWFHAEARDSTPKLAPSVHLFALTKLQSSHATFKTMETMTVQRRRMSVSTCLIRRDAKKANSVSSILTSFARLSGYRARLNNL